MQLLEGCMWGKQKGITCLAVESSLINIRDHGDDRCQSHTALTASLSISSSVCLVAIIKPFKKRTLKKE